MDLQEAIIFLRPANSKQTFVHNFYRGMSKIETFTFGMCVMREHCDLCNFPFELNIYMFAVQSLRCLVYELRSNCVCDKMKLQLMF